MRTAIRAIITHDGDTWNASIGEPLTGLDSQGQPLRSNSVVVSIHPKNRLLRTIGGTGWEPEAQVHAVTDVEWAEVEFETLARVDLAATVTERLAAGWALHATLDIAEDNDQVRAFFTRSSD